MNKIAVIIIHFGNASPTENCINSIKGLNGEDKIIVVDNSNNFNSNNSNVTVLKSVKNLGFGGGVNLGIEFAIAEGYEYFVVSNNDVVFTENFFGYLKNEMLAGETFQNKIISPKINYLQKKNVIWYNGGYVDYVCMEGKHFDIDKTEKEIDFVREKEIDFFTGAVFGLSSEVFNKVGKFNEAFFLYYEDLDYSIRAKKVGVKIIFEPKLLVFHSVSLNTKNKKRFTNFDEKIYFYLIKNKKYVISKYSKGLGKITAKFCLYLKAVKYLAGFLILLKIKIFLVILRVLF